MCTSCLGFCYNICMSELEFNQSKELQQSCEISGRKSHSQILEFDKVLQYLSECATSNLAKKRCLKSEIFDDPNKIKLELDLTTQARKALDSGSLYPLEDIKDILASLNDAKKQLRLSEVEIYQIADVMRTARLVRNYLDKFSGEYSELSQLKDSLFVDKELEDKILDTIDSTMNVKETATKELKSLHQSLRDTYANIKRTISGLLSNTSFVSNLQDTVYTQREGRTVFQVKAECKNKIAGIVHDVSASSQTYFIEPKELVGLNNKVRELEAQINAEIEKILKELTQEIAIYYDELVFSFNQLIEIDFVFAKAKYSIKIDGVGAKISSDKKIVLKFMKNPVLMRVTKKIVENDFFLEKENNCLIITGSNTGGKTVIIKTVGLCVLMTKAGLHIPCYDAEIYPFKKVFADIGDEQSIIQSLSTFSSHMNNIVSIVNQADEETLILLDEISAGTDPAEGSSLAQSILEYLQRKGAFCVATTHYGELKSLAYLKKGFQNASVEFDLESLSPTYKLLIGIPGSSNAIAIAKNLGINDEIATNAREIYFTQKDPSARVLEELQTTQQQLSQSTKSVKQSEENLKTLEDELSEKLTDIKKGKKKNIEIYKKKYETSINEARSEIKQILKEIHNQKSEKIARRSFARLANIENKLRSDFAKDEEEIAETYKPIDWQNAKVGDKVIIKNLNQEAELVTLPDKNKNITIQMGMIKTTVKQDKIAVYNKKLVKNVEKKTYLQKTSLNLRRHELSQTLDLRGYRCEEALDTIETYLDKASLLNLSPVYIIHGHGTGALKQVIRDYLSSSPYVAKYRAGEAAEGGDGVSVIDIN